MSKIPFLTIIIPQYNESQNLKRGVLDEVYAYLQKQLYEWEVIIVDDGSEDESLKYSVKFAKRHKNFLVIPADHGGKALALLQGIELARGEYILTIDMDQSTPLYEIEKLLPFVSKGIKVVIGSRGNTRTNSTLLRKIASFLFSSIRRFLLLGEIHDTQCGFKLYQKQVIQTYFPLLQAIRPKNIQGWSVSAFDVELLYCIKANGFEIKEVGVEWNDRDRASNKNRKFLTESIDMLRQIIHIKVFGYQRRYKKPV